jgi:site-specific recombinase XerC
MSPCWDENYLVALGQTDLIEHFLDFIKKEKDLAPRTQQLYHSVLWNLLDYFAKSISDQHTKPLWTNCSQQVIFSYLKQSEDRGLSTTTIAKKRAIIKSFFEFLVAIGYLKENPITYY